MRAFIATYVIGYLVFASQALFELDFWKRGYAVWDKTCILLLLYACMNARKGEAKILKPIYWLAASRLLWEFISWPFGWDINHPKAVGVFFILFSIYVLYKLVKDARN